VLGQKDTFDFKGHGGWVSDSTFGVSARDGGVERTAKPRTQRDYSTANGETRNYSIPMSRLAVQTVPCELVSIDEFPVRREETGNFRKNRGFWLTDVEKARGTSVC
jgi:hypothetical protein